MTYTKKPTKQPRKPREKKLVIREVRLPLSSSETVADMLRMCTEAGQRPEDVWLDVQTYRGGGCACCGDGIETEIHLCYTVTEVPK